MARQTGVVRMWKEDKGFGFIRPDGSSADVFVHYTAIETEGARRRNLAEGQSVEFDIESTPKGPAAVGVRATS